ncbi:unnamed protein product, partial [Prorocentrum cordatum]
PLRLELPWLQPSRQGLCPPPGPRGAAWRRGAHARPQARPGRRLRQSGGPVELPPGAGWAAARPHGVEAGVQCRLASGAKVQQVVRVRWRIQPWSHRVIHDPDIFREYEYTRQRETLSLFRGIQSVTGTIIVSFSIIEWLCGSRSLLGMFGNMLPCVASKAIIEFFASKMEDKSYRISNLESCGIQIVVVLLNSVVSLVVSCGEDEPHQLEIFYVGYLARVFVCSSVGYARSGGLHMLLYALFWVVANVGLGVGLRRAVGTGLIIATVSVLVHRSVDAANQRSFLLTRELEQARESLEQVLSAQHSVFSTIFDATGACDAAGHIVQSTPQMLELLAMDDLLHSSFASLAASQEEQRRVQEFLRTAWSAGVGRATMIQARLRRGADRGADAPRGDAFEASIVCVRLPGASVASPLSRLWAHDGLCLCIKEVACGLSQIRRCKRCSVAEHHDRRPGPNLSAPYVEPHPSVRAPPPRPELGRQRPA